MSVWRASARVLSLALCAVALNGPLASAAERVGFRAADGVTLSGTIYVPDRHPAPAVVLVHMLHRSGGDWTPLAEPLRAAGFVVLAIDLRGHGASGGAVDEGNLSVLVKDVAAGAAWLKSHPDVDPQRLGMVGASLGANLVVLAAAADSSVRSVALLSAGLDYRGVRTEAAFKKIAERPTLLVAGTNDPYAVRSARELATAGPNARSLLLTDGGHGTMMFFRSSELIGQLVDWFRSTLL